MTYFDKIGLASRGFARAFPFIVPLFSLVLGILFQQFSGIYFFFLSYGLDLCNHITKQIVKKMYGDKESFPLIGIGKRPEGARHCGVFVAEEGDGISTGYGMPSGHAQIAMITMVFWGMYLLDKFGWNDRTYLSVILLSAICIAIVVSRVLLGCHTVQQVIIGALIGLPLGYLGYKVYKYIHKYFMDIVKGFQY
jgi:membrane-associated phospholipid phosphatase